MPRKKTAKPTGPSKHREKLDLIDTQRGKLPHAYQIAFRSLRIMWSNRLLLGGIAAIYGVLYLAFGQALTSLSGANLSGAFTRAFNGHPGSLFSGFNLFVLLIGSGGSNASSSANAYRTFLFLAVSLAVIYVLRTVMSGGTTKFRDAFYKGMYPLIPFILVIVWLAVEFIPLVVAGFLYSLSQNAGVAVNLFDNIILDIVFLLIASVSFYFVTSGVFAAYIVTLPDMTPMKAIRSARTIVKKRRLVVFAKLAFLPAFVLVIGAILMVPFILLMKPVISIVFIILSLIFFEFMHTYLYSLYRELIE